jgi:hypothetical protein
VASVGLEKYLAQQYISGATCLMALLVVIIGSIEQYLGIQAHMEIDLVASKDYYFLATDIYKVLSLNRIHRLQNGKDCLDEMYNRFRKITENANILTRKYEDPLFEMPRTSEHIGIEILQSSEELPSSSSSDNGD